MTYISKFLKFLIIGIFLFPSNLVLADQNMGYFEGADPNGYLFNKLIKGWLADNGLRLRGWGKFSVLFNDHEGADQTITGAFSHDEGITFNQLVLLLEKAPKSNVIGRVGPLPGPKPESFDWGFTLTSIYGSDAIYFKTAGLDDQWSLDKRDKEKLAFNQFFLDLYVPFLDGTNIMIGSFHSPLQNEIGFALDPPSPFGTRTMAFLHGPSKHFGALVQSKLPIDPKYGLLSLELGVVNGWWNLENQNNDLNALYAVRWRSNNMKTWFDFEGSYGNGESDLGGEAGSPQGSSPFLAVSTTDEILIRTHHNVTLTHMIDPKWSIAVDASYGTHEGATNLALPFGVTEDSEWYGVNAAVFYQYRANIKFGLRGEWFKDDDGAHVFWQTFNPVTGEVTKYDDHIYSLTASMSWTPKRFIRIRPEIRYDWAKGDSTPFNKIGPKTNPMERVVDAGLLPGTRDSQLVGGIDITVFF